MKDTITDSPEDYNFGELSKVNSAGLINSTIINLRQDFYRHFRAGRYLSANSDLDCIWTILGGEVGVDENSREEKEFNEIEKLLSESGELQDGFSSIGFKVATTEQINKFKKQKPLLLRKARFLQKLQNSQGKGSAYRNKDDDDLD